MGKNNNILLSQMMMYNSEDVLPDCGLDLSITCYDNSILLQLKLALPPTQQQWWNELLLYKRYKYDFSPNLMVPIGYMDIDIIV